MATGPSISSVACLNCIGFLLECCPRYFVPRYKGFNLEPIFDFLGRLVHGWQANICPPSDARRNARQPGLETLMSIFDLSGRVAVITGGNGGIGLGIAQALAATGCNVSIWGRNADKNKSASATMAGCAGKGDTHICAVSEPALGKSAMAATLQIFGRVDGCFANAGIGGGGRHAFIDRTAQQWRRMFATNPDGGFYVFETDARH